VPHQPGRGKRPGWLYLETQGSGNCELLNIPQRFNKLPFMKVQLGWSTAARSSDLRVQRAATAPRAR
jgi:hypothetical protein